MILCIIEYFRAGVGLFRMIATTRVKSLQFTLSSPHFRNSYCFDCENENSLGFGSPIKNGITLV